MRIVATLLLGASLIVAGFVAYFVISFIRYCYDALTMYDHLDE